MSKTLKTLAFSTATLFASSTALIAAPLNIELQDPIIDIPFASAEYVEFDGVGDFVVFDAPTIVDGANGDTFASIFFNFETTNPYDTIDASFEINDDDGLFLSGLLTDIGFEEDLLQLLFTTDGGSAANMFGETFAAELFFITPTGMSPLENLVDGEVYDIAANGGAIAMDDAVSPIPLPASLPALALGLGGLGLIRARRKA